MAPIVILLLLSICLSFGQSATAETATSIKMIGAVDSNSPAYWQDGKLYIYNSSGMPLRVEGISAARATSARPVLFNSYERIRRWFESIWTDTDGTIYAWYHFEPDGMCAGTYLTEPQIGAAKSTDGGFTFTDLGIVITSPYKPHCGNTNGFFAGGSGDFSVVVDRQKTFFYFYFSQYGGDVSKQGVATARIAMGDRNSPVGKVRKYFNGLWDQPGLDGEATPILSARSGWDTGSTDAFWGPSLHWNYYLQKYVMLLNHACCTDEWPQEGIYLSYLADPADPEKLTPPLKIADSTAWYPQILGSNKTDTDTIAGATARLYIGGESKHTLRFTK